MYNKRNTIIVIFGVLLWLVIAPLSVMGMSFNNYVTVNHGAFSDFWSDVYGNSYNVDNDADGPQCWDGFALFMHNVGGYIPPTEKPEECWTVYRDEIQSRNPKLFLSYDQDIEITKGDILVFSGSGGGYIGFAVNQPVYQDGTIEVLAQNLQNMQDISGNYMDCFTVYELNLSSFLGGFHYIPWWDPQTTDGAFPIVNYARLDLTTVTTNGFSLSIDAEDDRDLKDIFIRIRGYRNFGAPVIPEKIIYKSSPEYSMYYRDTIDINLEQEGIANYDEYSIDVEVVDRVGNRARYVFQKPVPILAIDTQGCCKYYTLQHDCDKYYYPKRLDDFKCGTLDQALKPKVFVEGFLSNSANPDDGPWARINDGSGEYWVDANALADDSFSYDEVYAVQYDCDVYWGPRCSDDFKCGTLKKLDNPFVFVFGHVANDYGSWYGIEYHKSECWVEEQALDRVPDYLNLDNNDLYRNLPEFLRNALDNANRFLYLCHSIKNIGVDDLDESIIIPGKSVNYPYFELASTDTQTLIDSGESFVATENEDYAISLHSDGEQVVAALDEYVGIGGEVEIPQDIGGFPVVEISSDAFRNYGSIMSLTIPESIQYVGSDAFADCIGITELTIPDTVEVIGEGAFENCTSLVSLTLPESTNNYYNRCDNDHGETTRIHDGAFYGCTGLKEITMPVCLDTFWIFSSDISGVETIHYLKGEAGIMCNILDSDDASKRIEYYSRESLKHLYFEEGIVNIASYAYYGDDFCFSDIQLPSTLEIIGDYAFYNNDSLTALQIPDNVYDIGVHAFAGSSLESVTLPAGLTYIRNSCFSGCTELTEVNLPASLEDIYIEPIYIEPYAFYNCTALTGLPQIPDGATVCLQDHSFAGCTGITELTIPSTVGYISEGAFENCTGMVSLTLPEKTRASHQNQWGDIVVYPEAFNGCTGLKEITMPVDLDTCRIFSSDVSSVETIHYLKGYDGVMLDYDSDDYSQRIEYYSRESLKHLYFEEGIVSIGDYAYYRDSFWSSDIQLPSTLERIGDYAFYNNDSLTTLQIPDNVFDIGVHAFAGSSLESVTLPAGLTYIPDSCFSGCTELTEVILPASLEFIDSYAFYNCTALMEVYDKPSSHLRNIYDDVFSGCPEALTFFGYSDSWLEEYTRGAGLHFVTLDEEWTADMILPADLITIEEESFENCAFYSIEIPEGVQTIKTRAFADSKTLRRISIPESVSYIEADAFDGTTCLVVYCESGSYASQYAKNKGFMTVER